ncbi:MAG: hypothetical protein NTW16_05005 [Bacteroidetes bacterium]|nr:hypothetical protein [Bacteroidota bacterium]
MKRLIFFSLILCSFPGIAQKIESFDKITAKLVKIPNGTGAPVPSTGLLYGLQNHLYWGDHRIDTTGNLTGFAKRDSSNVTTMQLIASNSIVKYVGNPVLSMGTTGSWDVGGVCDPCVIQDDGIYKMWYLSYNSSGTSQGIGYATSPDGFTWTKYVGNPVLANGAEGRYDAYMWEGRVIKDGSIYKMWYQSSPNANASVPFYTNYATSADGITWTKSDANPVLMGGDGKWDQDYCGIRDVFKIGATYHAFYEGNASGGLFGIGYATSTDGVSWTKISVDSSVFPITAGAWDDNHIGFSVMRENNQFVMLYSLVRGSPFLVGLASSYDGVHWNKYLNNPIGNLLGTASEWDNVNSFCYAPEFIKDSTNGQNRYLIYYRAMTGAGFKIGAAIMDPHSTTGNVYVLGNHTTTGITKTDSLKVTGTGSVGNLVVDGTAILGKLGVGISAPTANIHAESSSGVVSEILLSSYPAQTGTGNQSIAQFDLRHINLSTAYARSLLLWNKTTSHYEYKQSLSVAGSALNYMLIDLNSSAYQLQSGIATVDFQNTGVTTLASNSGSKVGIYTLSPTAKLDLNSDIFRIRTAKTPASAAASGNTGDVCWDANYIYICTATNTWKRSAISTW